MKLGTMVEEALSRVGVTHDRVERWLGDCGCADRREKLDRLGAWAARVVGGKISRAREYLSVIIDSDAGGPDAPTPGDRA